MDKLFWGFLLLFLDLNLGNLNVLPDWAGYILILSALRELAQRESLLFEKPRPWCVIMTGYTGLLWAGQLLGFTAEHNLITAPLTLAATCVSLYITWLIINAIAEVESRRSVDLDSAYLRKVWTVVAVCDVAAHALMLLPPVAAICLLVSFFMGILFLVALNRTRKAYLAVAGQ